MSSLDLVHVTLAYTTPHQVVGMCEVPLKTRGPHFNLPIRFSLAKIRNSSSSQEARGQGQRRSPFHREGIWLTTAWIRVS